MSVGASLVARLVHRGKYQAGWDVLGPALGTHILATAPFTETIRHLARNTREYWYWSGRTSLFYTLVPGILNAVAPSAHWGDVVTLLVVWAALLLTGSAVGLPWRQFWIVLLAWGCSPSLLSFAVRGMPSATGILPHALALWLVLDRRLRHRPLLSAAFGLLWLETSWQFYESGRTSLVVLVSGALFLQDAGRRNRAAWIALALAQGWMLRSHASAVSSDIGHALARMYLPGVLLGDLVAWFDKLFVHPSLSLPTLFVTAVVAMANMRARRMFWFWLAVLGAQFVLVLALASIDVGQLIARRYLVFEYDCLAVTLALFGDAAVGDLRVSRDRLVRSLVLGIFVGGNVVQLAVMTRHFRTPASRQEFPLPFTSAPVDSKVNPDLVTWGLDLERRAREGAALVVLYNGCTFSEWPTDPAAAMEQVYLRLGHDQFVRSVFVFATPRCRPDGFPSRPAEELPQTIASLLGAAKNVEVHYREDFPSDLREARQSLRGGYLEEEAASAGRGTFFRLIGSRSSEDFEAALCSTASEALTEPGPEPAQPEPLSREALANGLFNEFPSQWRSRSQRSDGSTEFSWSPGGAGMAHVSITARKPDDAAWLQDARVEPDTWYRVSGWLRTTGVGPIGAAASLEVSGAASASFPGLRGTEDWQHQTAWVRTARNQTSLTVSCRLGGNSSLASGRVDCGGISVVAVRSPAEGAVNVVEAAAPTQRFPWMWPAAIVFLTWVTVSIERVATERRTMGGLGPGRTSIERLGTSLEEVWAGCRPIAICLGVVVLFHGIYALSQLLEQQPGYPLYRLELGADYRSFHRSAELVALGVDPYDNERLVTPPLSVGFGLPLSELEFGRAAVVIFWFSLAAVLTAYVVGVRLHLERWSRLQPPSLAAGLALLLLSYPVLFLADRGNIDGLVALLVWVGLWLVCAVRRDVSGGVFLGLAGAIKLYPLLLLLPAAIRGRRRVLAGAAFTVLASFTFHPTESWRFFSSRLQERSAPYVRMENASAMAAVDTVADALRTLRMTVEMERVKLVSNTLFLLLVAVLALVDWQHRGRSRERRAFDAFGFSCWLPLAILVPSTVYAYEIVNVIPILPLLAAIAARNSPSRLHRYAVTLAAAGLGLAQVHAYALTMMLDRRLPSRTTAGLNAIGVLLLAIGLIAAYATVPAENSEEAPDPNGVAPVSWTVHPFRGGPAAGSRATPPPNAP